MTTYCWKFSKFCLNPKGRDCLRSDGFARGTITWVSTTKSCHLFLLFFLLLIPSRRTRNSQFIGRKTQLMQFMLKSQQKVDRKLSKICQSHQKLSEWQKVASRFTEIVVKTHENVGVVSSYLSGYLSTSWIKARDNRQLNFNDTDVGSCKQCQDLLTLLALLVKWKTIEFLYYLDELYGKWTCIRIQFCLFKQHWRRNYRAVFPTAHKVSLWFFWFN